MGKGGIWAFLSFGVSGCNVTKKSQRQSSNNVILSDNHYNAQKKHPVCCTGKGEAALPVLYDNISQKRDDFSHMYLLSTFIAPKISSADADSHFLS